MTVVHLHVHSEFSWSDGACIIDRLVQRAEQLKMPAVAITDRNSVAGVSRLWSKCIKAGIKPIIGLEIEVLNLPGDGRAFSVILLARNSRGYANLCRLISLAFEHDPLAPGITKAQLKAHAQDLICMSFSVVGELSTLLLEGKDARAREVSDWYRGVFGEDFYYEIQNHGLPKEALAMNKILNMAYQTRIPVVPSNDCHYLEGKDSLAIDALHCIRRGIDFGHPDAKRFACNEYYFKSYRELKALFDFPPHLTRNTGQIADKIDISSGYIPFDQSDLSPELLLQLVHEFSPGLRAKTPAGTKQVIVAMSKSKHPALLEYLHHKLPDYRILPFTEYRSWTPAGIYAEVLRVLRVGEDKIHQLCELIPPEAATLLDATLISTDFASVASEDFVCGAALEMGDTLINTFADERASKFIYGLIPKDMPIPVSRDRDGQPRCQYEPRMIAQMGLNSLLFEP